MARRKITPDFTFVKTPRKIIDNQVYGLIQTGTIAERPIAGINERYYYATDENILYRDNGSAWVVAVLLPSYTPIDKDGDTMFGNLAAGTTLFLLRRDAADYGGDFANYP